MIIRIWIPIWIKYGEFPCPKSHPQCRKWNATIVEKPFAYTLCMYIYIYSVCIYIYIHMHVHCHFITTSLLVTCLCSTVQSTADMNMNMEKKTKTQCTSHIEWLNTRNYPDLAFLALIFDPYPHGYGSIPIKIQFSGGWTSINPSCFWTDRGLPWPMAIIRRGHCGAFGGHGDAVFDGWTETRHRVPWQWIGSKHQTWRLFMNTMGMGFEHHVCLLFLMMMHRNNNKIKQQKWLYVDMMKI